MDSLIPFTPRRRQTRPRRVTRAFGGALLAVLTLASFPSAQAASSARADLSPGKTATAAVGPSFADGAGSFSFVVPAASARPLYLGLQYRAPSISQGYRTRVRLLADGTLMAGFSRVSRGNETVLLSQGVGVKVKPGQTVHVNSTIQGTSQVALAVRAWVDGAAKPDWQKRYTDSSAQRIKSAGTMRTWAYLSSRAASGTSVTFKNVSGSAAATPPTTPVPPAPTPPSTPTSVKPSASTTGVPAGTSLTRHNGNITVTKAGTVLDRMDIHGFVNVKAPNVRISNSIVRGGVARGNTGLITDYGYAGLHVQNVSLVAEHPSVYIDGLKGNNFTATRIHVVGNVDSVKIHGDNVTVTDSLLENTRYYASDPSQGGQHSHNDNIQILYGKNINIQRNTIRGATNFAVLGAANSGSVPNLVVSNNWLDGGYCTLKLQTLHGHAMTATARNNKFGPNRTVKSCPFQAEPAVRLTASGNVYEANGALVPILRKVS